MIVKEKKVAIPLNAGHRFRQNIENNIEVEGNEVVSIPLNAGHRFQFRGTHSL